MPNGPDSFYPTTLVADIDPENPLVVQEQFGPALPIIRYSDLEWAIEQANALDVGWVLGVVLRSRPCPGSRGPHRGRHRVDQRARRDRPADPFGGIKSSGFGVEFGVEGLKHVAVPQVING
ncbi:Succinate-semialdehyde dehydrogenase [NADP(+)] 1 [Rothia kristinae]|nr:Succinate-semialdehyde dehydrogenase [NADP(+)] 1 [Rothia kristinae]